MGRKEQLPMCLCLVLIQSQPFTSCGTHYFLPSQPNHTHISLRAKGPQQEKRGQLSTYPCLPLRQMTRHTAMGWEQRLPVRGQHVPGESGLGSCVRKALGMAFLTAKCTYSTPRTRSSEGCLAHPRGSLHRSVLPGVPPQKDARGLRRPWVYWARSDQSFP